MYRAFLAASWLLPCSLIAVLSGCPSDSKDPADESDAGNLPDAKPEIDAALHDAGVADAESPGELPRDAQIATDASVAVPVVCNVKAPTSCPKPAPTYGEVQPIFTRRCGICHGQDWSGEWPLDSYSHIADWQEEIRSELVGCTMPPADAGPIPDADRNAILNWIRCGLPK